MSGVDRKLSESDLPPKELMDAVRNFECEREELAGSYIRLNPGKPLGVTCAISTKMPTKEDHEADEALEKAMPIDIYENDIDICSRLQVLSMLNEMAVGWVKNCGVSKKLPKDIVDSLNCHIRTFGSFRLGVHSKGGDIDALLVAPKFIERKDFFTSFVVCLNQCPYIHDLIVIEDAFVPLIKFQYDDIEIDMLFARVNMIECHDKISLLEDDVLKNLDVRCVRSLNGCRVTDEILRLVPNSKVFRSALRVIKHWAKNRGVYSNVLGFMGGVTWAMMVARVCQLYPNALAGTIVRKFFFVFYKWSWPEPVILRNMSDKKISGMPQWNPLTNTADSYHLMPVITPANPQQNSTHNISRSSKALLLGEFERGMKVCEDIFQKKCSWKILSARYNFFKRYRHYIMVSAVSKTKKRYLEWRSYVESRVRHLVTNLEKNKALKFAHVYCKRLEPKKKEENLYICNWFVGVAIQDFVIEGAKSSSASKNANTRVNLDLSNEIYWFQQTINNRHGLTRNFNRAEHFMRINPIGRLQIQNFVPENEFNVKTLKPYYKMVPVFKQATTIEQIKSRKRVSHEVDSYKASCERSMHTGRPDSTSSEHTESSQNSKTETSQSHTTSNGATSKDLFIENSESDTKRESGAYSVDEERERSSSVQNKSKASAETETSLLDFSGNFSICSVKSNENFMGNLYKAEEFPQLGLETSEEFVVGRDQETVAATKILNGDAQAD